MSGIRGKNTAPEIMLRKAVRKLGYPYRLQYGRYKMDLAFTSKGVAVFVDGCFWHKCPLHFRIPKSNKRFWRKKIFGNARRDKRTTVELRKKGWLVLRFWEHQVKKKPAVVARKIGNAISKRR